MGRISFRERLRRGLSKTREAIAGRIQRIGFRGRKVDDQFLDELEEILIEADLGVGLAMELRENLSRTARGKQIESSADLLELVHDQLIELIPQETDDDAPPEDGPRVTMVVGVNGSGKTTTTGKLASRWAQSGRKVIVAAADTFRPAAIEQLVVWAERSGARVIRASPGTDPAAVAFDAVKAGRAGDYDDVLIDTAGRLHTKKPLMDELTKVARVVKKEMPDAPHETLLVVDGTTGMNGVQQAREFSSAVPITALALTKLDGTARGGVAIAIGRELGLPVRYVGVGESGEDLLDFDAREYVRGLLGGEEGLQQTAEAEGTEAEDVPAENAET